MFSLRIWVGSPFLLWDPSAYWFTPYLSSPLGCLIGISHSLCPKQALVFLSSSPWTCSSQSVPHLSIYSVFPVVQSQTLGDILDSFSDNPHLIHQKLLSYSESGHFSPSPLLPPWAPARIIIGPLNWSPASIFAFLQSILTNHRDQRDHVKIKV